MIAGEHTPDTPYRSGTSGKYKLLIKSVTPKYGDFQYTLSDADGKEYYTNTKAHYGEGALLRCMVSFKVERAKLVVEAVSICGKQDLTTPIIEEKKLQQQPVLEKKPIKTNKKQIPAFRRPPKPIGLGSPSDWTRKVFDGTPVEVGENGYYILTVDLGLTWFGDGVTRYQYRLHDDNGKSYCTTSNKKYYRNHRIVCYIEIKQGYSGTLYLVRFADDGTSKPVTQAMQEKPAKEKQTINKVTNTSPTPKKKEKKEPKQPSIYFNRFIKGERYTFTVTGGYDSAGNPIVKDNEGRKHLLTGANCSYAEGAKIRCKVSGMGNYANYALDKEYLVLTEPRIVPNDTSRIPIGTAARWHAKVQDLGKHKCGKPFKCSCCGGSFPANTGWRVDLKDIYFCNACAREIYEPKGRGNHHFYIPTPM